jgi:hypothetical protein
MPPENGVVTVHHFCYADEHVVFDFRQGDITLNALWIKSDAQFSCGVVRFMKFL